ncbi:hypothetical protein X769_22105 [Mesorhizobium sp. LSJC268A00]|nr:hypothetical protein X769_22105 [Mesorhizobium sp. LSJC268A00]
MAKALVDLIRICGRGPAWSLTRCTAWNCRWQAAKERQHAWPTYAYNVKDLRNQETQIARKAQESYENFVEAWRPRSPKAKASGRVNPARLE